jgi:hypothetical protein
VGLSRARARECHILSGALRLRLPVSPSGCASSAQRLASTQSAERPAVTGMMIIPQPSGWRRSQAQGLAATRTPGSVGTVRLRLRVVLNLINPSRAQSTASGNQVYPSGRDRCPVGGLTILLSGGDRDSKHRDAGGTRVALGTLR